jgi:hypothetical protein
MDSDSLERTILSGGLSLTTGISPSYGLVTRGSDLDAFGLARALLAECLLLTGALSLSTGLSPSYGIATRGWDLHGRASRLAI